MEIIQDFIAAHNPSSIVNIFNNALTGEAVRKLLRVRGIYSPGKGIPYNGYYYDTLKDESTDGFITLVVPALLRTTLVPQQTIECTAFITKKPYTSGGRIELQVNIVDLIGQVETKHTDDQLKAFDILQRKADIGYRDVDSFIKTKILKDETITITILIGKTAIIDSDIKHQLAEAISFYQFEFVRINLASEEEIIAALEAHQATDILCISRGGGDKLQVFDSVAIAEEAIALVPFFVAAIGHKENTPLVQKIADKSFITPTALGQYFNDIYNETIDQLQNSKAKLVESITSQLKGIYEKQLLNVTEKLKQTEQLHQKTLNANTSLLQKEIETLQGQLVTIATNHKDNVRSLQQITDAKLQFATEQLNVAKRKALRQLVLIVIVSIVAILVGIVLGKLFSA